MGDRKTSGRNVSISGAELMEARLRSLQRRLGVKRDGVVGPVTLTRIESLLDSNSRLDRAGQGVGVSSTTSLLVSRLGLHQIVKFEISSDANYEKRLAKPTWPGGESGVTIGIGYDLGFNSVTNIRDDWRGLIPDEDLERLATVAGKKGDKAADAVKGLKDIIVPLDAAKKVFFTLTMPKFARITLKTYPGVEKLPADAQAGLLSLIYNRGASLEGPRRTEMLAIKSLAPKGDLAGIANQLRSMKRLWDIKKLPGLHVRRDKEAELIENARTQYPPDELVRV